MRQFLRGFTYAGKGIRSGFRSEKNMKFHLLAAVLVIGGGIYFNVSATEWAILLVCTGSVITTELINTAIEKLVDLVSPEVNPKAGMIKDLAAGAVLITAIVSAIAGCFVFLPKLCL